MPISRDPFDPDNLRKGEYYWEQLQNADNDRLMAMFREIWETIPEEQRAEFSSCLDALDKLQDRISVLSGSLLSVANISTNSDMCHDVPNDQRTPIMKLLAVLKHDVYVPPSCLLNAIEEWESDSCPSA